MADPLIFDIQRFSIHDGPGIRTVVFFKGCNLSCPWCQNPESIALNPEIALYPGNCIGSLDCIKVCEPKALTFNGTIQLDRNKCDQCGKCALACVTGALKIIGKEYTAEEVMAEILSDADYYSSSGGGVTFSGGEPTLHFDFLLQLLKLCKENSIHTNIETNGYFSWDKFEKLLPYLNLIYFDIKITDVENCRSILSGNSPRIIENMKKLINCQAPVEFRLPLIPGYTTNGENLADILKLLSESGVKNIHLLPYHSMGEIKGEKIGSPLPYPGLKSFNEEELKSFQKIFEKNSINTIFYR